MPKTKGGRFVVAVLVAFTVSMGLGVALASDNAPATTLSFPDARLGDRAGYDITLWGDWEYGDRQPGEPFPFLSFEWSQAEPLLDRSGARLESDQVAMGGLSYSPPNTALDGEGKPVEKSAWSPLDVVWRMIPSAMDVIAVETSGQVTVRSPRGVPTPVSNLSLPLADSFDGDLVVRAYPEPTEGRASTPCLASEAWLNGSVSLRDTLQLTPCILPALMYLRGEVGLRFQEVDMVRGMMAFRFEGKDEMGQRITIWLADGVPYPVRYQAETSTLLAGPVSSSPPAMGQGTFILELTGLSYGAIQRQAGGVLHGGLSPPATAPTHPWGVDESGTAMEFPPSAALQVALEQDGRVRSFLSAAPDAYLARSAYIDVGDQNTIDRTWDLMLTDGPRTLGLQVHQTASPAGASQLAGELQPWLENVPPVPRETFVYEHEVQVEEVDEVFPAPGLWSRQWPTAASLVKSWMHHTGNEPDPRLAWSVLVNPCDDVTPCAPRVTFLVGLDRYRQNFLYSEDREDPLIGYSEHDYSLLAVDSSGKALFLSDIRLRSGARADTPVTGSPEADPQPETASAAALRSWFPNAPEAAGATLLGLVLGMLYYAWPTVKSGILGLFSRFTGPKLLEHPARARLVQLIQAEPGVHFQDLVRRAGLSNGAAVHHLGKLAGAGLVSSRPLGRYTCYFPGPSPDRSSLVAAPVTRSDGARRILAELTAQPGLSGVDLAARLGVQPSTITYHVKRLQEAGLVSAARDGRVVRLRVVAAGG